MRGSQAVWCLGTFSYHPYIILHFGFDYENETQFYVLVVFYCPSARLPMLHGQGIITERKFENYTLITKIYDTLRDEQNRRKERPANTVNGNQKSFGHLKGAKTIAR